MSEHTPGPWKTDVTDFGSISGSTHYVAVEDGSRTVAYVIAHDWQGEPPYRANAHLIAAAPDMLEALERADATIDAMALAALRVGLEGTEWDEVAGAAGLYGAQYAIRTAIRLAKGYPQ